MYLKPEHFSELQRRFAKAKAATARKHLGQDFVRRVVERGTGHSNTRVVELRPQLCRVVLVLGAPATEDHKICRELLISRVASASEVLDVDPIGGRLVLYDARKPVQAGVERIPQRRQAAQPREDVGDVQHAGCQ